MPKSKVTISSNKKDVRPEEVAALYLELGWGTRERYSAARMKRSLANCDIVVSVRNDAGELVGIARALTDHALDTKILDMIIVPEYQKQGIGALMMEKIASLAKGTTLYGETEKKKFGFLKKCGFEKRAGLRVFVKRG